MYRQDQVNQPEEVDYNAYRKDSRKNRLSNKWRDKQRKQVKRSRNWKQEEDEED